MTAPLSEADLILNADGSVYHIGLRPEHLTDVILTVGDPDRVPKVSRYFDRIEARIERREFHAHIGQVGKQRLMVISSGMGTDNVEILLTELDMLANVDLVTRLAKDCFRKLTIIRIGTSGALQATIPVDSYVVSRCVFGLDTLMHFYPLTMRVDEQQWAQQLGEYLSLGFSPYCVGGADQLLAQWAEKMRVGTTVTCPGFYAPQGRKMRIPPQIDQLPEKLARFRFSHDESLTNFEMETSGYYALSRLLGHDAISLNAILANRATQEFSSQPAQTVDKLIQKVLENIETIR